MNSQDVAVALMIVVIWGVNFVALRLGLNGVPPMLMVCGRFVLSAFPAVFLVKRPNVPLRYLIGYGLFVGVGQYSLLYGALKLGMPAGLSSIVMQIQAFFTIGFAVLLLKEKIRPQQIIGMLVAFVGLGLIAANFQQTAGGLVLLMVVGAAMSWGLANAIVRMAPKTDMLSFTIWASLVPPLPMLALSLLLEGPAAITTAITHLSLTSILAMCYTAYLSTILCFVAWNKLISRLGAGAVAPFSLLVPFFGLLSTSIVLGERVPAATLLAGGVILVGLAINVFGTRIVSLLGFKPKMA